MPMSGAGDAEAQAWLVQVQELLPVKNPEAANLHLVHLVLQTLLHCQNTKAVIKVLTAAIQHQPVKAAEPVIPLLNMPLQELPVL